MPTDHRIPNIQRLIAEGEEIIYIGRQHFLYGWQYLLGAGAGLAGAMLCGLYVPLPYLDWALFASAMLFLTMYALPFYYFEMAVTTHRLLAQQGRWDVQMLEILPIHLDHWDLKQNVLLGLIRAGHVTLHLRSGMQLRETCFYWLDDPLSLLAHMEKLSPNNATQKNAEGKPKLPATVENQKTAPAGGVEPAPPVQNATAHKPAQPAKPPKAKAPDITGQSFAPGLGGSLKPPPAPDRSSKITAG